QGLSTDNIWSVLATGDGNVWLTTSAGLNKWNHGQFSAYDRATTRSQRTTRMRSLFQDERGRIWVATADEFGYLEDGGFVFIRGIPGGTVRSIVEDTSGSLWIANQDVGLFRLSPGGGVQKIPWTQLGHKDFATALAIDPVRGGLWLGFFEGSVVYFQDGQVRASYTSADGLGEGLVNDFRLDQNGTLWAATGGGLSVLKNGRISTLTTRNGLPCNTVHWMIEDNADSFWLSTSCGLVRIARSELEAWAATVDRNKDARRII